MKFKGTKGKFESHGWWVHSSRGTFCKCTVGDREERITNAILIADAFNTVNECDMMPSELLARYNEAVEKNERLTIMNTNLIELNDRMLILIKY